MRVQRYQLEDGRVRDYLSLSSQGGDKHYSPALSEWIQTWSNELSYPSMSALLASQTGIDMSASGLEQWVVGQAARRSDVWEASVAETALVPLPVVEGIDVYNAESKEIKVFVDDVGVKAQKPHRQRERLETDAKRLDTTVVLVEDKLGHSQCLTPGMEDSPLEQESNLQKRLAATLRGQYGQQALPIVAITDGARSIRLFLVAVFGPGGCIILDWYHLQKKVTDLLSMIAVNKGEKQQYVQQISALLWRGEVQKARASIESMPQVKNTLKQAELLGYLAKHEKEIIDYERRKSIGKTIGSGMVEKANDVIVAKRQKKKGMSWSKKGSRALAILKVEQLNKNLRNAA